MGSPEMGNHEGNALYYFKYTSLLGGDFLFQKEKILQEKFLMN